MSIKTTLTNTFGKTIGTVKAKSPEIILAASICGVVATVVTACVVTKDAEPVIEEHKKDLADLKEKFEKNEISKANKDRLTTVIYVKTGLKIVKIYRKPIIYGTASIAGIVLSHKIQTNRINTLKKENVALAGTLTATEKAFKKYRDGVIDRFGKEIDEQLRYGIRQEEFEETKTDENGNTKTVKQTLNIANKDNAGSPYVRYITESHPLWQLCGGDEQYLIAQLRMKQSMWNDTLKSRPERFVGINEVYTDLKFQPVSDFMVSGWEYVPSDTTIDQYVEFDVREVVLPDEYGEFHRAYAVDFNAHNVYTKRKERTEKVFRKS